MTKNGHNVRITLSPLPYTFGFFSQKKAVLGWLFSFAKIFSRNTKTVHTQSKTDFCPETKIGLLRLRAVFRITATAAMTIIMISFSGEL